MSAITSETPKQSGLRLPATAQCLVLDPAFGPVPRALARLAEGEAVLVQTEGAMCFRPVSQVTPRPPPCPRGPAAARFVGARPPDCGFAALAAPGIVARRGSGAAAASDADDRQCVVPALAARPVDGDTAGGAGASV